jgi:ribosome-binding ATPase YchF (GTP1/OBG family)
MFYGSLAATRAQAVSGPDSLTPDIIEDMSLSLGIVGLPNVGKSTLFNALTKKGVPAENYPFFTIDPSVGIVAVPDERLWKLSAFSQTQKNSSCSDRVC